MLKIFLRIALMDSKEILSRTQQLLESGKSEELADLIKALTQNLDDTKHELGEAKHELGEAKHELGEAKHELGETKHELGETKHKLGETKHELDREKKLRKIAEDEVKKTAIINNLLAGPVSKRAKFINDCVKSSNDLGWEPAPEVVVKQLWNSVKEKENPVSYEDENRDLHPWFSNVLSMISMRLGANFTILNRPSVSVGGPSPISPGFLIGPAGLSSMSFHDSRLIFELKRTSTSFNSALSEAAEYLGHSIEYSYKNISIGCNFHEIQAIWLCDEMELRKSPKLSLFPDINWKDLAEPTAGFRLLCNILCYPVGPAKNVCINGNLVPITGTLFDDGIIAIHTCMHGNQEILVKIGIEKRAKGTVNLELQKYKIVLGHGEMAPFLVPEPELPAEVKDGFAMMKGSPLYIVTDLAELKIHLSRAFLGIKQLHALGLYHLDIRPSNFVIYEGTCRIIDWTTMTNSEGYLLLLQGQDDPFWPRNPRSFVTKLAEWDLIHFGLCLCYMASNEVQKLCFLDGIDERDAFIQEINATNSSFNDLQCIGARIVKEVEQCIASQTRINYDNIYNLFNV